jgi:hypothetical protein
MEKIRSFMEENDIKRMIVADPANQVVLDERREELPFDGLFNSLFGDTIRIGRLRESLRGEILPQGWAQSGLASHVTITPKNYLIGVFWTPAKGDPVATYRAGKRVMSEAVPLVDGEIAPA